MSSRESNASLDPRFVEIQVRTELQQLWAELSEKYSDLIDPSIKYGGGSDKLRTELDELSAMIASGKLDEAEVERLHALDFDKPLSEEMRKHLDLLEDVVHTQQRLLRQLLEMLAMSARPEGLSHDIFDRS